MKKALPSTTLWRGIIILLSVFLFFSVILLMKHVQTLLNSDVEITLTEIVVQNKNIISERLKLELNTLSTLAEQISEELAAANPKDDAHVKLLLKNYSQELEKDSTFIADQDGSAYLSDGRTINITERSYFQLAMEGVDNISERITSKDSGDEVFMFSIPIRLDGTVVGTLQIPYTIDEMNDIFALSIFSSKGYIYIINSDGYIIFHSKHEGCHQRFDNYFQDLYSAGDTKEAQSLINNIKAETGGFLQSHTNNQKTLSAYTPIEEVHDWYLITSVPNSAVSPNGNIVFYLFYIILLGISVVFCLLFLFISILKNRQSTTLEKIAFVDTITKGYTYNKFTTVVPKILASHPEISFYILKFDIDNFKYVNNNYGFDFGDKVLCDIIEHFQKQLTNLELIARMSGDNFVVLLENVDSSRLEALLNGVADYPDVLINLSGGIYPIVDLNEDVNLMVDKAGTAANTVKGSLNKKYALYSESFDNLTIQNEKMKKSIKQALANDELIPFYQPKVDVNTGKMVGSEALARWQTHDGHLISPCDFIPLCENTGLITDVDMAIFEKVLQFLHRQLSQNVTCTPISVNFSRLHLTDKSFLEKIVGLLEIYQVPSHLIEIELTESAIFDNNGIILGFTDALRHQGLLVAMDDFGSGYSSLNMLKEIPIDILKVDKGFLDNTSDPVRRNIIFGSIVDMAHKLDIKVVVEGVEDLENVELMKACNCSIAQGYYFAKPMPENIFEKVFKAGVVR